MKTLADIKRRIAVGTRLKCVENTLRPVLNGTTREVKRVLTVAFTWSQEGEANLRDSWTHYPKASGVKVVDANTFKFTLGGEHWVTLQFID